MAFLNLGGSPRRLTGVAQVDQERFSNLHAIAGYSEHLSACADEGNLYDLCLWPREETYCRIGQPPAGRFSDVLERQMIIENVSATPRCPAK